MNYAKSSHRSVPKLCRSGTAITVHWPPRCHSQPEKSVKPVVAVAVAKSFTRPCERSVRALIFLPFFRLPFHKRAQLRARPFRALVAKAYIDNVSCHFSELGESGTNDSFIATFGPSPPPSLCCLLRVCVRRNGRFDGGGNTVDTAND